VPSAQAAAQAAVEALARRALGSQAVPDRQAETAAWNRTIDEAATSAMRALLHEPRWQRLEAAWRGVLALLQSLELDDGGPEVHLLDASAQELVADLVAAQGDARRTGLHRALVGRWKGVPGAPGWDAFVGLHRFGPGAADMALLAAWSLVAESAGCPFVADGDPVLAADPADPGLAAWMALRRSPSARWVGLVAPRLLLRQPYGARSDPVQAFGFEELAPGVPDAGRLLWGPGALGWARCFAQSRAAGEGAAVSVRRIEDLPAVAYTGADGERELVPVAEAFNGEDALAALARAGLMPLASHRHEAVATLAAVRSVADPATALAGP
jgi:type VI secretion system protein ImpC